MLYKNAHIFTENGVFCYGSFRVEDGKFAEILTTVPEEAGVDLQGAWVIPGLVDDISTAAPMPISLTAIMKASREWPLRWLDSVSLPLPPRP